MNACACAGLQPLTPQVTKRLTLARGDYLINENEALWLTVIPKPEPEPEDEKEEKKEETE